MARTSTSCRPIRRGELRLTSTGTSRYRELEATTRYLGGERRDLTLSYVWAKATADLNNYDQFYGNFRNPILRANEHNLIPTDVRHRLLVRGTIGLPGKWDFAPVLELRSGFPWSAVDEFQDFVGPRNRAGRLPAVRTLDFSLTRPWRFRKYRFRAGVKMYNVFGASADRDVQNNLSSPYYGTSTTPSNARSDSCSARRSSERSSQRAKRPTRSRRAAASASGAPARLSSTPMLVSERSWPGGNSAVQKNSPTPKPIAAMSRRRGVRASRDEAADADPRRGRAPAPIRTPSGLPTRTAIGSPTSLAPAREGHPGVDEAEKEQRDLGRVSPPDLESAQRVPSRRGCASTKNPGSRAA